MVNKNHDSSGEYNPDDMKNKILAAIAHAQDTEQATMIGNLRGKNNLPDTEVNLLERQYTALGEYLLNVSMEPLYEAYQEGLSIKDTLWLIHAISTAGWVPDSGGDHEKEERSLDYRLHEVKVGDLIPPKNEDVEALMDTYATKVEAMLVEKNNLQEEMLVCAWSYMLFVVVHPYSDGNGRTGRGIVKFLDHLFQRKRGIQEDMCTQRTFPNRKDSDGQAAAVESLTNAIHFDHLVPVQSNSSSQYPSSFMRYAELSGKGQPNDYFKEAKYLLNSYFDGITDAVDLYDNPFLAELVTHMMATDYIKPGETEPLIASDGLIAYKKSLDI